MKTFEEIFPIEGGFYDGYYWACLPPSSLPPEIIGVRYDNIKNQYVVDVIGQDKKYSEEL